MIQIQSHDEMYKTFTYRSIYNFSTAEFVQNATYIYNNKFVILCTYRSKNVTNIAQSHLKRYKARQKCLRHAMNILSVISFYAWQYTTGKVTSHQDQYFYTLPQ